MRSLPTLAFAAVLALATAAFAQTRAPAGPAAPAPTTPDAAAAVASVNDLPPIAEDQRQADAMTAQLAALDQLMESDEARLTTLRDAELARQNVRIRAIKPVLPFHGPTWLPRWL